MKYDTCHLVTSSNDGFMARITRSETKPGTPHHIIMRSIQRCPTAMQGPPINTCSTIEDLMPIGVMKEPAFTFYDGPCPACVAAENAVKEACRQTKYVFCRNRTGSINTDLMCRSMPLFLKLQLAALAR
jgi:hypothetical protein